MSVSEFNAYHNKTVSFYVKDQCYQVKISSTIASTATAISGGDVKVDIDKVDVDYNPGTGTSTIALTQIVRDHPNNNSSTYRAKGIPAAPDRITLNFDVVAAHASTNHWNKEVLLQLVFTGAMLIQDTGPFGGAAKPVGPSLRGHISAADDGGTPGPPCPEPHEVTEG